MRCSRSKRPARSSAATVELHFPYDEEAVPYDEEAGGEIGPKWLLNQRISRPDYAISAGFSYARGNYGAFARSATIWSKPRARA